MAAMETLLQVGEIQRFCLHDGPGIRSVLFLQGCPHECWWCHNTPLRERSAEAGTRLAVEEVRRRLLRDRRYWRASNGGVTVSGGEPLLQPAGLEELLHSLGDGGVHRCVETALACSTDRLDRLADLVDLWLVDLKHADAETLRSTTGIDLGGYRDDLLTLLDSRADVQLRIPLIRGFNDSPDDLEQIRSFLNDLPALPPVRILPGHDIARPAERSAAVGEEACRRAKVTISGCGASVEVGW
jgi:pyruvate formate lyase activating enzyme